MKRFNFFKVLPLAIILMLWGNFIFGQTKTFTWDTYYTKFSVPENFVVDQSTAEKWIGHNRNINLSIYPRKGENLSVTGMSAALHKWALSNGVQNIGAVTELAQEKLNGYWGVMYEGDKDGNSIGLMLIIDPDFPDISIYIWVAYNAGYEDDVLNILMSFTPN